jgi:hypothetical protein
MEATRMTFRKFFLSVLFAFLASLPSRTPAVALESLVIAYPTTSSQFTPLWFARDVGPTDFWQPR